VSLRTWWQSLTAEAPRVTETAKAEPAHLPERNGFEYGIGPGGLTEWNQELGRHRHRPPLDAVAAQRRLHGVPVGVGLRQRDRPHHHRGRPGDGVGSRGRRGAGAAAEASRGARLERMLAYCNPTESIIKILRGVIADLQVFGDAYLEVVWIGDQPVALYSLDCPSMMPSADEHGQVTEVRAASPSRGSVPSSSPARSSTSAWTRPAAPCSACRRRRPHAADHRLPVRRGHPEGDLPQGKPAADPRRHAGQLLAGRDQQVDRAAHDAQRRAAEHRRPDRHQGRRHRQRTAASRTVDYIKFLDQRRDEILACYGVPPAKVASSSPGTWAAARGSAGPHVPGQHLPAHRRTRPGGPELAPGRSSASASTAGA
jgi:hypothetical protein